MYCTYVRHKRERSGRNRPRREAYVATELFSPEAWGRHSWPLSSRQFATNQLELTADAQVFHNCVPGKNYNPIIVKKLYSIMDLCPRRII